MKHKTERSLRLLSLGLMFVVFCTLEGFKNPKGRALYFVLFWLLFGGTLVAFGAYGLWKQDGPSD